MGEQLSILRLIAQASVPVQIVIGILLLASLNSWAIIFRKRSVIARARREADRFESRFWSGGDLAQLYRTIESHGGATGMASIFEFGFREFARLRQQGGDRRAEQLLEGSRRAMRVAQLKEIDRLEHSLATLATVGSTSPYVGLFGTVWGIMSAFSSLGNVQQATLAHGGARHLRGAGRDRIRAVRGDPGGGRLQPLRRPGDAPGDALRRLHRGVLDHPAAPCGARRAGRGCAAARRRYAAADGGHMAQTTRGRRLMGEINVVPYIDVMLVLLIIFMITAPLLTQGVKVDLPKAAAEPLDAELLKNSSRWCCRSIAQGRLYLNIGAAIRTPPSIAQTVAVRATAALRREPELPVLVKADNAVAYGRVVQAMVMLQQAGARKVGFITEPPPRSEGRGG